MSDWPVWRERFVSMLDPALHTAEWLDLQVASGEMVLFANADAAILVSVRSYPTGLREIHGEAAVGELRDIVSALIPLAEIYGRECGCAFASIASRPGWSRELKVRGYDVHQVEIRKAL